ncbi:MAG: formylglycine-generating enzyme family protein [Candidatus Hydrogenedentes bacterium]|nr:formylglycine-generating enzyme family protein [Candidatus Hydrogenedentota bacterium]
MNEEAHCAKCGAQLPANATETLCPQCMPPLPASPFRVLCGILLLLLGGIWILFWGMIVAMSIATMDRGGGREAVGDAVGGGMMGLLGLVVIVAGIFLLRAPRKPVELSEKKSLAKWSILGGVIGFAVVSTLLLPVIPVMNMMRISEQPQVNQGLVRMALLIVLNGLPVVGAVLGAVVARRMGRRRQAGHRPGQGIPVARSVVGGLVGAAAALMTWLFVPPILVLAGLYKILGFPYAYDELVGFNLAMVSGGMLAVGVALGIIVARRLGHLQEPIQREHAEGGCAPDSLTAKPEASHGHARRRLLAAAACAAMFCLAATLFWRNAPGTSPALEPSMGTQPGEERTFAGITFCWCPPGSFTMGSPDTETGRKNNEGPQHTVTFKQGFWMSKHEVTHAQWKAVEGFHPEAMRGDDNLPMQMIDWHECQYFLRKLGRKEGGVFRLPSEAEWEYACRAGTQTPYSFGGTISGEQAHLERDTPKPVGRFPGNAWNLCDMHGGVREWCQDSWHEDYAGAPADGSAWESAGEGDRVFRSGGWDNMDRGAADRRSASRGHAMPGRHTQELGFRIVRAP